MGIGAAAQLLAILRSGQDESARGGVCQAQLCGDLAHELDEPHSHDRARHIVRTSLFPHRALASVVDDTVCVF
jgi:hypothetical protein